MLLDDLKISHFCNYKVVVNENVAFFREKTLRFKIPLLFRPFNKFKKYKSVHLKKEFPRIIMIKNDNNIR